MAETAPSAPFQFRGSFVLAARQFPRNRAATVGAIFLLLICLGALFAPWIAPDDPIKIKLAMKLRPPSLEHLMGTDHFGRDIFSRMLYGARTSLSVGLLVVGFAFALGVPLGLASGYFGGNVDNLLMRLVDAFLTFPPLLLAVALVGLLGPDIQNVMLALGLVQAPILARMVRGSTLAVREEVYVTAPARSGPRRRASCSPIFYATWCRRSSCSSPSCSPPRSSRRPRCPSSASARNRPIRAGAAT
jgi:peptide/nickel transport system permease protein